MPGRVHCKLALLVAALAVVLGVERGRAYAQVEEDIKEGDELFARGNEKDLRKAAKKYDRAIRKGPSLVPPGAYGKRAAIFFLLKDYAAGLDFVDQALKQHPGAPEVLEQKALILWETGKREQAIEIADQVAAERSSAYQVQLLRGQYYFAFKKDPATAAAAYSAYLSSRPAELASTDALKRLRLGLAYLDGSVGKYREAEEQFEIVRKQFRKSPQWVINANNGLCAAYTMNEKFDQAITMCEQITEDRRNIDAVGSVWYNLGRAYLKKKQPRKARQAGIEFIQVPSQRGKAKGYMLIGDAYFDEGSWEEALRYYQQAEERGGTGTYLLLQIGRAHRKLGDADLARPKLEEAAARNPDDPGIAAELGEVYLDRTLAVDRKALSAVERLLAADKFPNDPALRYVAARASYNLGDFSAARDHYRAALTNKQSGKYLDGLVQTINAQAGQALEKNDVRGAMEFLQEAKRTSPKSQLTNLNLGVVSIESGDCDGAHAFLKPILKSRRYRVVALRLQARAFMCQSKPNRKRAAARYEQAAKASGENKFLRAEIYAEWAPLLMDKNLDDAVAKLTEADQIAGQNADIGEAVQRNIALVMFRRGWENLRSRKTAAAISDLERAARNPTVLRGTERPAFEFSLAVAMLEAGETAEASKLLDRLSKDSKPGDYLRAPYNKVGVEFFSAYAEYRTNTTKARQHAASEFTRLQKSAKGKFADTLRELVGSTWHFLAVSEFRSGSTGSASKALATAARFADSAQEKRLIGHNQAVLAMLGGKAGKVSAFEELGGSPPEALVNLGIAYDRAGDSRKAYDSWIAARSKGAKTRDLDKWITAKRRIFGYQ